MILSDPREAQKSQFVFQLNIYQLSFIISIYLSMHIMRSILILLLVFFSIFANGQQTVVKKTKTITSSNLNWWKFEKDNYFILHPQDWVVDTSGTMGSSFILFAPVENTADQFKENVNLLIQNLEGKNISLNQYVQFSENQIKTMIQNAKIEESKRIKKDSLEYHSVMFTGEQGNYKLRFEQYYFLKAGKSYVLTFTHEQSKNEQYRRLGELMLSSFRIKD